ncbi:MAG: type II toxin-antitoxin system VapC family toxin [Chlorobiaceae bacterium]|nr:type II toxin-antitoxin system VapC family toxin [Chlorobiaceae bacterium]
MKIIADTNIFLAAVLEEPEKERIVQMTEGHELVAPDILPFEVGNALTSPLAIKGIKTAATTKDIIKAVKTSRSGER